MDRIIVGSYANPHAAGIQILDIDRQGVVTPHAQLTGIANPSFLVCANDMIYAVSETNAGSGAPGGVVAIRYTNGTLTAGARRPSGGDWPCHINLSRDGQFVLVANYGTGNVGLLRIGTNRDIAGLNDLVQHSGTGPVTSRQSEPHAHSTTITPDGRFVIAADLGTDELVFSAIQPTTTQLRRVHAIKAKPGSGPRHTVWHPSKPLLYVANEISCSVTVYRYADDTLQPLWEHATNAQPIGDSIVSDIHISPDGNFLCVATRGENTIATFRIHPDGNLTRLSVDDAGGAWPRNFCFAPDGAALLVACQNDNHIAVHQRDPVSGALGQITQRIPVPAVSFVQFFTQV